MTTLDVLGNLLCIVATVLAITGGFISILAKVDDERPKTWQGFRVSFINLTRGFILFLMIIAAGTIALAALWVVVWDGVISPSLHIYEKYHHPHGPM